MQNNKTVDQFIAKNSGWKRELELLRKISLSADLEEGIKWGFPVYMHEGKNIIGLGAFKSYVGIWFFQGGLLRDEKKVLVNAQEGKTKAMRQWRFNGLDQIDRPLVASYINEAIKNQKEGLEIKPEKNKPIEICDELAEAFAADAHLSEQYDGLSLSKRRDYADYIGNAKRTETRMTRLAKIIPMIKQGIGLNDKYKS